MQVYHSPLEYKGNILCVWTLWLKIVILTSGSSHNSSAKLPANKYGNRNTIVNRNGKLKTENPPWWQVLSREIAGSSWYSGRTGHGIGHTFLHNIPTLDMLWIPQSSFKYLNGLISASFTNKRDLSQYYASKFDFFYKYKKGSMILLSTMHLVTRKSHFTQKWPIDDVQIYNQGNIIWPKS